MIDNLVINLELLGAQDRRKARYLSALGNYRLLVAKFGTAAGASRFELAEALSEVEKWEPTAKERMLPLRGILQCFEGQVSESTIRRWAKDGQVARVRDGRCWLYDPNDVEHCIVTSLRPNALGRKKLRGKK